MLALVLTNQQDGSLIRFADARTIRIIRLLLIFFTAGQMQLILDDYIPFNHWTSAFLQVCFGLLIIRGVQCSEADPELVLGGSGTLPRTFY
jgi:hypothetical protein